MVAHARERVVGRYSLVIKHRVDMLDTIVVAGTMNASSERGRYDCMVVSYQMSSVHDK